MRKYTSLTWPWPRTNAVLVCYCVLSIFFSGTRGIAQSPASGLSEDDIMRALHHGVSSDAILHTIRKAGTSFDVDDTSESDLRKAGASKDLIGQIRQNTDARNAATLLPSAPPPQREPSTAPPVLSTVPAVSLTEPPPSGTPPAAALPPLAPVHKIKLYSIKFRNSYNTPIDIVVLFKNASGVWITKGWYELDVGEEDAFGSTSETQIYYYARSTLGQDKGLWAGTNDAPVAQVADRVITIKWSQVITEPGGYLVLFRSHDLSAGVPINLH